MSHSFDDDLQLASDGVLTRAELVARHGEDAGHLLDMHARLTDVGAVHVEPPPWYTVGPAIAGDPRPRRSRRRVAAVSIVGAFILVPAAAEGIEAVAPAAVEGTVIDRITDFLPWDRDLVSDRLPTDAPGDRPEVEGRDVDGNDSQRDGEPGERDTIVEPEVRERDPRQDTVRDDTLRDAPTTDGRSGTTSTTSDVRTDRSTTSTASDRNSGTARRGEDSTTTSVRRDATTTTEAQRDSTTTAVPRRTSTTSTTSLRDTTTTAPPRDAEADAATVGPPTTEVSATTDGGDDARRDGGG